MQIDDAIAIDEPARNGLARILDVILPGTTNLPSGRAVDAHRELLDKVVRADPQLQDPLVEAGNRAAAIAGDSALNGVRDLCGDHVEQVVFALTAAYYMAADVRAALGYPGQGRRPIAAATAQEVASDELVAPVVRRGPIYVPTPEG